MKATFTPLERLENAIRTYKSDGEIHDLDPAFPPPELKVEPKDIIEVVTQLRRSEEILRACKTSLEGGLETENEHEPEFSIVDKKLCQDIQRFLSKV